MNNVILVGRLTKDPDIKYIGDSQTPKVEFSIAINRDYKDKEGVIKTDFISIEVWNKQAEICNKYLSKGRLVGINGQIRVEKYQNQSGENRYITKVHASKIEFLDYANKGTQEDKKHYNSKNIFEEVGIDVNISEEELPF